MGVGVDETLPSIDVNPLENILMFTIRRKGKFNTLLSFGHPHCGIGDLVTFDYDSWICVSEDGLDENGFVVDNALFKQYFDGRDVTIISCEKICHDAVNYFLRFLSINRRKKYVKEICVRVWGLPGEAYAEYKYTPKRKILKSA